MRIVQIFPHLKPGGAERLVAHIMMHLDRSRFEVEGICLGRRSGSDLEDMLDRAGIPVQFLGKGPGFDPRTFGRVHRALQAARADVLHSHVHVLRYVVPYLAYSGLVGGRLRVLHTVHNVAEFEVEPRARWIQGLAFRRYVTPVAVAEEVAQSVTRMYGIPAPVVIPNCLPVQRYRSPAVPREKWREREGFPAGALLLTCVAGLRPQKNHPLLLEAFARLAAQRADAHLVLSGGGDQTELRALAARLGIMARVHFLGVRWDIPDLLAASDIFVLASHYEGNPLCVMEAMAAGLPVVAPSVGGIPELVRDGVEGFLVAPSDAEALAHAAGVLATDSDLRTRFGAASAARALRQFDVAHMVAAYERLYDPGASVPDTVVFGAGFSSRQTIQ